MLDADTCERKNIYIMYSKILKKSGTMSLTLFKTAEGKIVSEKYVN